MGRMPITRRSRAGAGAAIAALALVAPAPAAAAGGLALPLEDSPSGVLAPTTGTRYLTVSIAGHTAVLAQRTSSGRVTSRRDLRGRFGVPVVAFDSTAGGISADGATLVLARARDRYPRKQSEFAVMAVEPRLRRSQTVRLPGEFSFDALSPDGRSLFLVNYLSPSDPTKYRVRVYDLARRRLDPKAVVDPREPPDEMNGIPVTRVVGTGGRWAYTLYDGAGKHPFIHALDTVDRKAVCIDLEGTPFAGRNAYDLRLALGGRGSRLDLRRKGALVATVDTATFRVRTGAAALAAAGAVANDPAGPSPLWPGVGLALVAAGLLARRIGRRQARPRAREDLATRG
ncbi:MAG: hypothetical protein QOG56_1984 [Solirubrobacteraceae bacterium]|nr:hypothetical protein [Solirubrobacteraceae bacterium]